MRKESGKVICRLRQGQMYSDSFIVDKPLVSLVATENAQCVSLMWSEFSKFLTVGIIVTVDSGREQV